MARTSKAAKNQGNQSGNGANLGFEAKLWLAADKLRQNMDAAKYKHVLLGLIFLRGISDSFEEMHAKLLAGTDNYAGSNPEVPDEHLAETAFWVPKEARWNFIQSHAQSGYLDPKTKKSRDVGGLVDDAMEAIEKHDPRVKGALPKNYGCADLDRNRLGELIELIGTIGLGDTASRAKDILGRVYGYFLTQFASAEGKNGGQFCTPSCIVRLLVQKLAPYKGRVQDPCCGFGGMFMQYEKFILEHGGRIEDLSIYGQESNVPTRRMAIMDLAIRGIVADFGPVQTDTFRRDLHRDLKARFVVANPPFNNSDWHRVNDDVRWQYGTPPKGNANLAWVQHFIHHVASDGLARIGLINGSMATNLHLN